MHDDGLIDHDDGVRRCWWCGEDPEYVRYHDEEWGHVVRDDTRLFEKLCLEGFQSGLSWITILRKRPNFRAAFEGFEIPRVAKFGEKDVERLLGDAGIVRHRGKIEATIHNAGRAIALIEEFGSIHAFVGQYAPPAGRRPDRITLEYARATTTTDEAEAMSKELKRRGWKFVGPTTVYSFMQAMGVVNDHLTGCGIRDRLGTWE